MYKYFADSKNIKNDNKSKPKLMAGIVSNKVKIRVPPICTTALKSEKIKDKYCAKPDIINRDFTNIANGIKAATETNKLTTQKTNLHFKYWALFSLIILVSTLLKRLLDGSGAAILLNCGLIFFIYQFKSSNFKP